MVKDGWATLSELDLVLHKGQENCQEKDQDSGVLSQDQNVTAKSKDKNLASTLPATGMMNR